LQGDLEAVRAALAEAQQQLTTLQAEHAEQRRRAQAAVSEQEITELLLVV
jgi:septal ring factor EnvC (AmiA/AmiB activator)